MILPFFIFFSSRCSFVAWRSEPTLPLPRLLTQTTTSEVRSSAPRHSTKGAKKKTLLSIVKGLVPCVLNSGNFCSNYSIYSIGQRRRAGTHIFGRGGELPPAWRASWHVLKSGESRLELILGAARLRLRGCGASTRRPRGASP